MDADQRSADPAIGMRAVIDSRAAIDLRAEIDHLRRERQAVILAHYYQDAEIQDLADFVGDSLQLAQAAARTDAKAIVFQICGTFSIVRSSISVRSVSTRTGRSSSRQTRSQSGM